MSLAHFEKFLKLPEPALQAELNKLQAQDFRHMIKLALAEQERKIRALCADACLNKYTTAYNKSVL